MFSLDKLSLRISQSHDEFFYQSFTIFFLFFLFFALAIHKKSNLDRQVNPKTDLESS